MNYDQAKALMIEHHPDLLIDADEGGLPHINVRKSADGTPFSIMLPRMPLPPDTPYRAAIPPATLEDGAIVPGHPEVPAVSGQAELEKAERKMFLDALRAAQAHL